MKYYTNEELKEKGSTEILVISPYKLGTGVGIVCRIDKKDTFYTASVVEALPFKSCNYKRYKACYLNEDKSTIANSFSVAVEYLSTRHKDIKRKTSNNGGSLMSLPIQIDTSARTGVFLYVYLDGDAQFSTEYIGAIIVAQTLASWVAGLDIDERVEALKRVAEYLNCDREDFKITETYLEAPRYLTKESAYALRDERDNCLLFGDEEHAYENEKILFANRDTLQLVIADQSIIGEVVELKEEFDAELGEDYIDLGSPDSDFNTLPFMLDINEHLVEYVTYDIDYKYLIVGLYNQLGQIARRFKISAREAWRHYILNGPTKYKEAGYLVSANEFISLCNTSDNQFLDLISGRIDSGVLLYYNDFMNRAQSILNLLRNKETYYNFDSVIMDELTHNKTSKLGLLGNAECDLRIRLIVGSLPKLENFVYNYLYAINLNIFKEDTGELLALVQAESFKPADYSTPRAGRVLSVNYVGLSNDTWGKGVNKLIRSLRTCEKLLLKHKAEIEGQ